MYYREIYNGNKKYLSETFMIWELTTDVQNFKNAFYRL